ncbi:MAG: ATP synthase subunit a [candidate division WS6 bacterium OLB21]|uniref:ATP synthase subunit a n=1 Tax=candidate division WS6 bacterium OLB21 TaxID=1617427 RepID=A0A136KEH8_9BACT|nr:MAG: ATP synthase subunit a [candidate division WS6 bacterium OLB21]
MGSLFQLKSELISVQSDVIFSLFGIGFTNSMISALLVTSLLILLSIWASRSLQIYSKPGKFQLVIEIIVQTALNFFTQITGKEEIARRIFPIVGTLMLYLLISNTVLLIPGITSITYDGQSLFRPTTSDFNSTFGLAVAVIVFVHIFSIHKKGVPAYLNSYFRFGGIIEGFKKGIGAGILSFIDFFVGLLDVVSELAKSLSLSLRLFGNIFAGELLASVMMGIFALFLPIPFFVLSLFSGVIQAIVFSALTASYFGMALSEE